ncbi:MAG TPA: hypothetical protein VMU56_08755 [Beijerinckiaceae bacterium]|nr:hypothetical protein [Beijerinckiaceae bacterium]HVB89180.1 hypothetical protein [Beijerinckiaceae bacterium]
MRDIETMGETLGPQFSALWQQIAWLHSKWQEYVDMFGTKPSRVALLNRAAPKLFGDVQVCLWHETLLHIARLTDPPKSAGKPNLTIQNLAALTRTPAESSLIKAVDAAVSKSQFARDWRNRHIAHIDLDLALDRKVIPLAAASRLQVTEALHAIAFALNEVARLHRQAETYFAIGSSVGGAVCLLRILHDGLKQQERRDEALMRGDMPDDDCPRDL